MPDLLQVETESVLQEKVETVVLLEPQGSDEILEVPTEQLLLARAAHARAASRLAHGHAADVAVRQ